MAAASSVRMSGARPPKIQRWMDLIAALLRRRYSVTLEELTLEVPAYAKAPTLGAKVRMFERDKDELRAFGVAIETVFERERERATSGYVLRRRDFYLPYLAEATQSGAERGPGPERPGYRDLPRIVFEPDELAALTGAAMRVRGLGDPALAADADAAIRKLAFDLAPASLRGRPAGGCQGPSV